MSNQFSAEELLMIEELINDAVFANRKRLQHAQGKINLNVDGCKIREDSVEECRDAVSNALKWYDRVYEVRCKEEGVS